jgi:uncharacterized membrane protein YoaK (UPF0700 family)
MSTFFTEVRQTLAPRGDAKHGPLPPLLVAMTLVTGLVDAFSYLVLGHVFVANMTGNVVFLGFALAGAPDFSIPASLVALCSFILGSLGGGRLGSRLGQHRGRLLSTASALQTLLLTASAVIAALFANPMSARFSYGLIVMLGVAMGLQNAVARKLAVPDLTTTVLTLTIVGVVADSHIAGGSGSRAGRRLIAAAAMLLGALVGGVLILHLAIAVPLVIALVITASIAIATSLLSRGDPSWVHAS